MTAVDLVERIVVGCVEGYFRLTIKPYSKYKREFEHASAAHAAGKSTTIGRMASQHAWATFLSSEGSIHYF